jgi:anti-sigma B factor antagonist
MPRLGELDIDLACFGSQAVLAVGGEVDLATAPALREALASALHRPGVEVLVIDLTKVSFLDSTGVSTLTTADKQSLQRGVQIRLCGLSPGLHRVLAIVGLADRWPLFTDRSDALAPLGATP